MQLGGNWMADWVTLSCAVVFIVLGEEGRTDSSQSVLLGVENRGMG